MIGDLIWTIDAATGSVDFFTLKEISWRIVPHAARLAIVEWCSPGIQATWWFLCTQSGAGLAMGRGPMLLLDWTRGSDMDTITTLVVGASAPCEFRMGNASITVRQPISTGSLWRRRRMAPSPCSHSVRLPDAGSDAGQISLLRVDQCDRRPSAQSYPKRPAGADRLDRSRRGSLVDRILAREGPTCRYSRRTTSIVATLRASRCAVMDHGPPCGSPMATWSVWTYTGPGYSRKGRTMN
jgi:hypothetical protein